MARYLIVTGDTGEGLEIYYCLFRAREAQVLTAMNEARGRRLAAYPPLQTDIENAGGRFVDEAVVVDGTLISSRGWQDLSEFMREMVAMVTARRPVAVGSA